MNKLKVKQAIRKRNNQNEIYRNSNDIINLRNVILKIKANFDIKLCLITLNIIHTQ